MEGVRYREYELMLKPGAKLFVYTDGLAEANDKDEQLFGTERMTQALVAAQNGSAEEVIDRMRAAVDSFVGDAPQFDDLTMLCLTYKGVASATQADT